MVHKVEHRWIEYQCHCFNIINFICFITIFLSFSLFFLLRHVHLVLFVLFNFCLRKGERREEEEEEKRNERRLIRFSHLLYLSTHLMCIHFEWFWHGDNFSWPHRFSCIFHLIFYDLPLIYETNYHRFELRNAFKSFAMVFYLVRSVHPMPTTTSSSSSSNNFDKAIWNWYNDENCTGQQWLRCDFRIVNLICQSITLHFILLIAEVNVHNARSFLFSFSFTFYFYHNLSAKNINWAHGSWSYAIYL